MQSGAIRGLVGERRVLTEPCNLPVSGGSSLSSILWFRDEQPEVWTAAAKFGHCNTYLVKRMTGRWAIDASTSSMTGLYNTVSNDLTWNRSILGLAGIPEAKLPHLMHSHERVGRVLPVVADELGVPSGCSVLCGGNDAELAALSGGLTEPGDINIISGTCDMANVCTDRPAASPDFNVHGHVVPGRWLTFFVLNAGGAALDWLRRIPCSELILETTREDLLLSLVRGNATYLGEHLSHVAELVPSAAGWVAWQAELGWGRPVAAGWTARPRRWLRRLPRPLPKGCPPGVAHCPRQPGPAGRRGSRTGGDPGSG